MHRKQSRYPWSPGGAARRDRLHAAAKAKKNQACGQGGVLLSQNSVKAIEKIDTQKELAKIAGVSHDTIARVEKIVQKAPEEVKENQAQYFGNQYQSGLCQNSDKVHPINTRAPPPGERQERPTQKPVAGRSPTG